MAGLSLKRGDVVRVAAGKPRPAVIVQWDQLPTPINVLICPLTSFLIDAETFRPTVVPDATNGLHIVSQLMIDRLGPVRRDQIDGVIGKLGEADVLRLNAAITVTLGLSG